MSQALIESLRCNLGRTVTIFTTSGGLSGSGFTGVLVDVTPCVVKIITQIGAPPACAGVIWVQKKDAHKNERLFLFFGIVRATNQINIVALYYFHIHNIDMFGYLIPKT